MNSSASCVEIEQLLRLSLYQIASWIQLAIVLTIFVSIFTLFRHFFNHKIIIHGNLMILIANLVFLYFLTATFYGVSIVRYQVLFHFSFSPPNCELLLTPVWLAFLLAAPPYLYLVANPFFHLFIMAERCRATFFARHYENVGFRFGWICAVISWLVALLTVFGIVLSDLSDPIFSQPLAIISLTSQNNAMAIIFLHCAVLFLLIITSIGDYWVQKKNRKLISRYTLNSAEFGNYSIIRNYQIRENLLTMRLILPLDISYAILFGIFLLFGLVFRFYRSQMTKEIYVSVYNSATTLLLLHSAFTLVIYIKFIKYSSPNYDFANFGSSAGTFASNCQCQSEVISRPPVVIPPAGRHLATLIFFHGMGDECEGWADTFRSIFQPILKHTKFVAPNAKEMNGITAWFDHRGFDPSAEEDRKGLQKVTNYAHSGFSQGGPVALYSALAYPQPLGGILCLSGFLLPKDSLPTQIRQIPGLNVANFAVPIFIGHGTNDQNVPLSLAFSMANALRRFDPNVNLRIYQMGHENCAAELNEAR
ncbi:hypothetical protein niasHT_021594 [Heterodera trifolii]|uniref:palmitoyl-protein hydrolase n=1 Tax=Heterodera trifolii TaxID=157864 RepID=A0ABD2K647_9BILA